MKMSQKQIGDCVFLVMGIAAGSMFFVEQPRAGVSGWVWGGLAVVLLAAWMIYLDDAL